MWRVHVVLCLVGIVGVVQVCGLSFRGSFTNPMGGNVAGENPIKFTYSPDYQTAYFTNLTCVGQMSAKDFSLMGTVCHYNSMNYFYYTSALYFDSTGDYLFWSVFTKYNTKDAGVVKIRLSDFTVVGRLEFPNPMHKPSGLYFLAPSTSGELLGAIPDSHTLTIDPESFTITKNSSYSFTSDSWPGKDVNGYYYAFTAEQYIKVINLDTLLSREFGSLPSVAYEFDVQDDLMVIGGGQKISLLRLDGYEVKISDESTIITNDKQYINFLKIVGKKIYIAVVSHTDAELLEVDVDTLTIESKISLNRTHYPLYLFGFAAYNAKESELCLAISGELEEKSLIQCYSIP